MNILKYLALVIVLFVSFNLYAGTQTQHAVTITTKERTDEELYGYYDLRDRKTYVQITNEESQDVDALPEVCIHIQIFQQDKGCVELDFEDTLTPNDTVVYDMDNIVRNDGSAVPINLDDDSYGIVTISAYECGDRSEDSLSNPLLGNFRIIDDAGYEYRMNFFTDRNGRALLPSNFGEPPGPAEGNIIIPFNTVDGATHADIIAFVTDDNRLLDGTQSGSTNSDVVYNEENGIAFDVFQFDENEEPISCDRKTIGCGPNIVLNYGINEDYPASRGENLLCEGGGLKPGQTNGFISLENPTFLASINLEEEDTTTFEFFCMVGLNNGDGTGSMDSCLFSCDGNNFGPLCNTF